MAFLSSFLAIAIALAMAHVQPAIITKNWTISAGTVAPDGLNRVSALINGGYPGPLLKANKGDTVFVNVDNRLNDPGMRKSTSIVRLFLS